jgi:hypothetical protein
VVKRTLQVVAGVLLVLAGIGAAIGGGVLLSIFGREGTLSVQSGLLEGSGAALVTENLDVGGGGGLQQRLGTLTFGARSEDGTPVIGIAPPTRSSTTSRALPTTCCRHASGSRLLRPVPGRVLPPPPSQQSFWVASASGASPEFIWPGTSGDQRLVIMKPDGTRDVAARLTVTYRSSSMFGISVGLIVAGAVAILVGLVLLVLAWRGARRARKAADRGVDLGSLPPPTVAAEPASDPAASSGSCRVGAAGDRLATSCDGR